MIYNLISEIPGYLCAPFLKFMLRSSNEAEVLAVRSSLAIVESLSFPDEQECSNGVQPISIRQDCPCGLFLQFIQGTWNHRDLIANYPHVSS
jgi:hypothetical protein